MLLVMYSYDIKHKLNGYINATIHYQTCGGVAQMVERALSMREVPGSMPGTSTFCYVYFKTRLE